MKNTKRFFFGAFTLAEVLIVLGVIGVVAAMTIPTVVKNYKKTQFNTTLKKTYSEMSQVTQKIMLENGGSMVGAFTDSDTLRDGYAKYFKSVVKKCNFGNSANARNNGCFMPGLPKNIDKTSCTNANFGAYNSHFVLANGASVGFQAFHTADARNCILSYPAVLGDYYYCGGFSIDVNGAKPPNVVGIDYFPDFIFLKNGVAAIGNDNGAKLVCNQWADEYNIKAGCASLVFKGIDYY